MNRTFTDYLAIVEFLTTRQNVPLDEALRLAEVPLHLQDQVREYISGPVTIEPPAMLLGQQSVRLCEPLGEEDPQPYSTAFRAFLLAERRWARTVVENLADTSQTLVCRLAKPREGAAFQIRGLVVGHIQSGKTATMASLIARAADQGYKLFIVLAGLMNDLRAQTQRRLDQEIAGWSDDPADTPFVQQEPGAAPWIRLTRAGLAGDFEAGTVQMDVNPQTPKLLVIKKIPRIIERLTAWLRTSQLPLNQLPALIIDDEADQASIDTNYGRLDADNQPVDPSRTNACIRELLRLLPKCSYVGFTATPFANVLIDADANDDLYPRDFIASLPEPEGYLGPRQLFGLGMTPSDLTEEAPQEPIIDVIRPIPEELLEELDALTPGGECPEILSKALLTWLLSCCARLARGHDRADFSMVAHPSQRTADHTVFAETLNREIEFLRAVTARPRAFPDFLASARQLWNDDFLPVTRAAAPDEPLHGFDTIWRFARGVIEDAQICVLNFSSQDELHYSTPPPKRYVVVGGNRLSRGLTLEGLSVSVFTRTASTYDTLLQMGRWFGFRFRYHDLTRIFVEPQLSSLFADLARVELELRNDLRKYARQPDPPTPAELAPRIRVHPSMAVTSRLKMGAARPLFTFENSSQNTVNFPTGDRAALENNMDAARALIRRLGQPESRSTEGMHIWRDLPAQTIIEFLRVYIFGAGASIVTREGLISYIGKQNDSGELTHWDLCIPRGNPECDPVQWTPAVVSRKVMRTPSSPTAIGTLLSPGDRTQWLSLAGRDGDDPSLGCLLFYLVDHRESGAQERRPLFRDAGADILGLVLLFPRSRSGVTTRYISQHDQ